MKSMINHSARGFSLTEMLVAIAIVIILLSIGLVQVAKVMDASRATACRSNMRNLGAMSLLWSSENGNNVLPVVVYTTSVGGSGTTWIQLLMDSGYLPRDSWDGQSESVMRCPVRDNNPTLFGPRLHYGLNFYPGFNNRAANFAHNPAASIPFPKMMQIDRPAKTFMFGEVNMHYWLNTDGTRAANIYPHESGSNLVFYDGHVEYYKGELTLLEDAVDTFPFY